MLKRYLRSKKYSQIEISKFFRQLSLMLDSGVSLYGAIDLLKNNWEFCSDILDHINQGNSLSGSLKDLSVKISETAINFIRVGEQRGDLSGGLSRASIFLQNKDKFNKRIISSLSYPVFIIMLSLIALFILISVLLPTFESVYSGMNIQLPLVSRIAIKIGKLLFNNIISITILLTLVFIGSKKYFGTAKGSILLDRILFYLPYIGTLRKEIIISKLCDDICQAIKAGITIPESLLMSGNVVGSPIYRQRMSESVSLVRAGGKLSQVLDKTLFPDLALNMIAVGEATAKLDLVFDELRDYYEETVERKIKLFSTLVEPISTLVVGVIVGIIVLAMFMPMISLVNSMAF